MNKELYVSSTPHETRLAVAEDGEIAEAYYEREQEYSLAGSIYKGRVTRVLPGMQSAFVDIGLERDAFLYVSDFFEDSDEYDRVVSEAESAVAQLEPSAPSAAGEAGSEGSSEPGTVPAAAPSSSSEGEARWGRRGRHRGRRGKSGIPEEKFARPQAAAESGGNIAEPSTSSAQPGGEASPGGETAAQVSAMVLPGESLAKYRQQPERARAPEKREQPRRPPVETARPAPPAQSAPVVTPAAAFILPGESLAKYRTPPAPAPTPEPERVTLPALAAIEEDGGGEETEAEARESITEEQLQPDT
ncbi:MAG: hypothetical protein ACRD1Y_03250, partial [Terriglobales bacterium]